MNASEADMSTQNEDFVVSYLTLRQMIGWIGLLMPLAVRLGIEFVENGINPLASISAYYYSGMHDLFVCALILIGVLLACNRSPDVQDNVVSIVAGLSAIGIAFFPMDAATARKNVPNELANAHLIHGPSSFHLVFVVIFFALCIYMILFRFVVAHETPTPQKIIRNRIYRVCGGIMALACVWMVPLMFTGNESPIFWPETIAVISFGVAWLVKGQTFFLKDRVTAGSDVAPRTAVPSIVAP